MRNKIRQENMIKSKVHNRKGYKKIADDFKMKLREIEKTEILEDAVAAKGIKKNQ